MLSYLVKGTVFTGLVALLLGLGVVFASTTEITHPVPSHVKVSVLPLQWSADVDFSGRVDFNDLLTVLARLNTSASSGERVDINHDGVVDVVDLAIVARYIGDDVQL